MSSGAIIYMKINIHLSTKNNDIINIILGMKRIYKACVSFKFETNKQTKSKRV